VPERFSFYIQTFLVSIFADLHPPFGGWYAMYEYIIVGRKEREKENLMGIS
jgi:hypothetical protein